MFFLTAIAGALVKPPTAKDILAHQASFRLGYALTLISTACYVALVGLFYVLFRHVSRTIALLAAFFGLVGCAVAAVQSVFQLGPTLVLGGTPTSTAFNVEQLQAMAQTLLDLSVQAGYVALAFFGLFNLSIGYLIFRSTFLPRVLGVLMALSGLGWLTFLAPPLAIRWVTVMEPVGFLAEALLMFWLLVMGINSQRWKEQAV